MLNICLSEHLKSVPDALEALISEKRLIQASVLLIRSLKLINKPDMREIGAVADLRAYLLAQEIVSSQSILRDPTRLIVTGTPRYPGR